MEDAETELEYAKTEMKEFDERYSQRVTTLEEILWKQEYKNKDEKKELEREKAMLVAERRRLEKRRENRLKEVEKLRRNLGPASNSLYGTYTF